MDVIRRTDLERLALQDAGTVRLAVPANRSRRARGTAGPHQAQEPAARGYRGPPGRRGAAADGQQCPGPAASAGERRPVLAVPERRPGPVQPPGVVAGPAGPPGPSRAGGGGGQVPHQPPVAAADRRRPLLRPGPQPAPDPAAGGNPRPAGGGPPARGPTGGSRRPAGRGGPEAAAAVCRRPGRRGRQGDLSWPRVHRRRPERAGAAVLPQGQPGAAGGPGRRARPDGAGRRGAPGGALAPRSTPTRIWSTRSSPAARSSWASTSCTPGSGPSSSPCSSRPTARRPGSTTNLPVPAGPRAIPGRSSGPSRKAASRLCSPTGVSSTNGSQSPNEERALRDVLEVTAVTTLLKGGTVYALPAGTVPGDGSAAAVFRYSAPVSAGSDQLNGKEK
jgi:hypothetical protein